MNRNQRGALRENPRNSHHWIDPVEQFVTPSSTGDSDWGVWDYDACCLFASRRKKQRIVHNIEHMRLLPNLVCGHVHSQDEWKPELQANGRYYYPSKEEAEYTAHLCFTIVAACSHWAVSKGLAVHKITRLPPMQTAGDWRPLLSLDSEVFRKQAMPALAAFLGLTVLADAPKRVQVHSCWTPQTSRRSKRLLLGLMVGLRVPAALASPVSQASVIASACALFPSVQWGDFKWPFLEDLLNTPTFLDYSTWMLSVHPDHDGELGPLVLGRGGVALQRASVQDQTGAAARRHSLAPLVPFGLDPDHHFQFALDSHAHGSPLDWMGPNDHDLQFTARAMAQGPAQVHSLRQLNFAVLCDLSTRLLPVSEFLRAWQPVEVRQVNPVVHLAMLAILTIMMGWPDTSFPSQLLLGFPAVGYVPPCGLWDVKPAEYISLDDVLAGGLHDAQDLLAHMRHSDDDQVAVDSGNQDEAAGFCSPAISWEQLLALNQPFRLIRRFVIEQSSGKKRVIDDANLGHQSAFSSDANQLRFCSAIQPCLHLQALRVAMGCPTTQWPDDISSSGEDLPSAYRKIPMIPAHTWACLVCYRDPGRSCTLFRRYHGMLFGLPLADMPRQGKAGVLLVHPSCGRLGTVIRIDASIFDLWSSHPTKIAQLELLAVVQGLLSYPSLFRHARVVWYVDNIAALMALVRGRSDNPELDHMSQIAHLLLYQLQSYAYWEWVPSSSNWADGISREGASDPWLLRHGFRIHSSSVYTALWRFPFRVLSRVFAYLS
eukprot:Skav212047  [mRNA]  locus=scaffold2377:23795:26543:+ [translate_table: standard]